ncbi:MAG: FAD-dependent oxidoreductase [Candidatus Wildermuthbacteria bacterium]|nr:FAD-dependent oxidoreductase [Candidatus Wildermuthbacteria bacterium]
MAAFTVKLKKREEIAKGTMAFFFERPETFQFTAGQYCRIALNNPPETDAEGDIRLFSVASAPMEKSIMIATRMRDTAFKRTLKTMTLENEVQLAGPYGNLVLRNVENNMPAVFLAGGIGIIPFRSMIVQAAEERLDRDMYLFYSNNTSQDAAFLDELITLQENNPRYKCIPTMTAMEQSQETWQGEKGYITHEMIKKYVSDTGNAVYYIAGPPAMVRAMEDMLEKSGVSDSNIRAEEFSGY